MRKRYIQHPETGELIPAEDYIPPRVKTHFIAPDIQPYKSMQTGEMIGSRSHHREHLRRHQLIEVGNEVNHMLTGFKRKGIDREQRRRDIADAINGRGY